MKTVNQMGENTCKSCFIRGLYLEYIKNAQFNKNANNLMLKQAKDLNVFLKSIYI